VLPQPRRWLWVSAALVALLAPPARGAVVDGGAAGDAAVTDAVGPGSGLETPTPPPPELVRPPELSAAQSTTVAQPLIDTPTPAQAEPPRPITKRLWFWMAISGVIVAASVTFMAVRNPNVTRPECPPEYVCPR
jgi:hypothetical protein